MKEKFKKTPEIQSITNKIDEAIGKMDMAEIEKELTKLSEDKPFPYQIEDSTIFAKRIIKQKKKGYERMRKSIKKFGPLVASLVLIIGITAVYGTELFKNFKFYNEKTTVEIRTNQEISEEEAARMAKEAEEDYNSPSKQEETIKVTTNTFSSIEAVEKNTGVEIILPTYIPEDFQMEKDIMVQNTFNDNHQIYITYKSKEKENRMLGVTIITQNQREDSTVVTVTDAVHKGEYKTPSGTKYSILKEDEGSIASININNIEYDLVFMGVNEEEMHRVIDSADVSRYMK